MRPLLTIAIPAYNVEQYLENATSAFRHYSSAELEVLIINDGSTDGTLNIATKIAQEMSCVKVINKKNGGHGSAINTGIQKATGKYFKLLDGDDWLDPDILKKFIDRLKHETSDLILTEHIEIYQKTNKKVKSHDYSNLKSDELLRLDSVSFQKYGPTLPNTTIKTAILKKANFKIDEHCFYVDQEYNLISYAYSNTVIKYDFPLYCYRLERNGQSMEKKSLKRNVASHEKVCIRLLEETSKLDLSQLKTTHLHKNIIAPLCNLQYDIAIKYCHSICHFRSFDKKLSKYPDYYNDNLVAGNIIKLHRKTNGFTIILDPIISKIGKLIHSK